MIEINVSKQDLIKLKMLDEFDSKDNVLQTSAAQYIQFVVQPERLSPEGFQRNGANQNVDADFVDMVKGISPDLLGSSDSPNSANT